MSFILDALKRADAERARGTVPGLTSQPLAKPVAGGAALGRGRRAVFLTGVGVAGALVVAVLAVTLGRARWWSDPVAVAGQMSAGAAPARLPAEARPVVPPTSRIGPVVPAPLLVQADTRPAAATSAEPGASGLAGVMVPVPVVQPRPDRDLAVGRVLAWEALPPDIRQRFPKVKTGGGMYSPQASSRLVVLNDQVWHEGDQVAPGLVVLEIRPSGVVLGYQQQQVLVKF